MKTLSTIFFSNQTLQCTSGVSIGCLDQADKLIYRIDMPAFLALARPLANIASPLLFSHLTKK